MYVVAIFLIYISCWSQVKTHDHQTNPWFYILNLINFLVIIMLSLKKIGVVSACITNGKNIELERKETDEKDCVHH